MERWNMQSGVVEKAKRNLLFGVINKSILMICPFVERLVIQMVLGSQYLGLGSLYTSILNVLSLTELGFGAAMVYNMYKPVAEGDVEKVNALLGYYRKVYRIVGAAILLFGTMVIPFLPYLIEGSHPADVNLTYLYLIYLFNASISYFLFAYVTSLVVVNQRDDIQSAVNSVIKILLTSSQAVVLLVTSNYYLFAILLPVFTIANNLWLAYRVKKCFPQYKPQGSISESDKKGLRKLVFGTFVNQACLVTRNALDSICVSAFLGLSFTAIYNNYYMVLSGAATCVAIICNAFIGGVGIHVATKSVAENFEELKKIDFLYLIVGGWCATFMLCLYQPFMQLWMGEDMMFPMEVVIMLCVYFYLLKLGDMRSMYSSAKGLWWEQRYRALTETLLNLVLNVVLGKFFGVYGIIAATMISLFLCNYVWSVAIVFRLYFSLDRRKEYYTYQFKQSLVNLFVAAVTYLLVSKLTIENLYLRLGIRVVICTVIPAIVYYLIYRKNENFQYLISRILKRNKRRHHDEG